MRVALRNMAVSDAEVLGSWAVDPEFCAHAGWTHRSTPDLAIEWWQKAILEPDPLLIRLAAVRDDELVGYVDLHGDGRSERELGFVIGPSRHWDQGLGTAAATAGLTYGFTVLGLSAIWAEALEANESSVRILRRIGMRETGAGGVDTFRGVSSRYRRFRLSVGEWNCPLR